MVDPYKLSLMACVVVAVFYGGLFGILAAWTSSARWRHSALAFALAFLHNARQACAQALAQICAHARAWMFTRRLIAPSRRPRQYLRPYPPQYLWQYPRLGDISRANSGMSTLEVDITSMDTRTDLPAIPSGAAFPLYTPPTVPPRSSTTTTLVDERPQEQGHEQGQPTGQPTEYAVYRPRDGYTPPEWPPKPKRPHTRTYRYVFVSGILVDLDNLPRVQPPILPWYHDN